VKPPALEHAISGQVQVDRQFKAAVFQQIHIAHSQLHAMITTLCLTHPSAISVASFTIMVSKRVLIILLHYVTATHVRISYPR
jgi:hypothetical protein